MDEIIKTMIEILKESDAGFASLPIGKYTIIITDDPDGAKYLSDAWDKYAVIESDKVKDEDNE